MAAGLFPFPGFNDPGSAGDSIISSITIEDRDAEVALPRRFSKYSSQSFLDPTEITLQLVSNWVARGHRLATMQSPFRIISLSTQMILLLTRL